MQHQPGNHLGLLRRQPQRRTHMQRDFSTELRMIAAPALGDIVQQHRHIQRPVGLHLPDQFTGHRCDVGQLPGLDAVQHLDRLHRMHIHREHMIGVELHLPHNPPPIRQIAPQHPGFVQQRHPSGAIAAGFLALLSLAAAKQI